MIQTFDIPLLKHLQTKARFPDAEFYSKKLRLIYSLLSKQYARKMLSQKDLLIYPETLATIKDYLAKNYNNKRRLYEDYEEGLITFTMKDGKTYDTYLFILSILNDNLNINILSYKEIEFVSWLGGVIKKDEDIHISVQHNLAEEDVIRFLDLFNFLIDLTNLEDFELIYCKPLNDSSKQKEEKYIRSSLIQIDISTIRKYLVASTERREHYRWQFCGEGRTILKRVRVKSTLVKEYLRSGKRIN